MNDTRTPNHCEPLASATGARFDGFFNAGNRRSYGKDKLLDARARRIFDMTEAACQASVYPYQIALQGRSGPWVRIEGRDMLSLSAYDYLGLIGDPRIDEAAKDAIDKYGTGTASARMLTGTIDLHHRMEDEMAAFKGMDEAVSFSSGYLANLACGFGAAGTAGPRDPGRSFAPQSGGCVPPGRSRRYSGSATTTRSRCGRNSKTARPPTGR